MCLAINLAAPALYDIVLNVNDNYNLNMELLCLAK